MKVEIELVSPERAAAMLARNSHNRKVKPSAVRRLVAAIERGEWELTMDGVGNEFDGPFLNGQHRLMAIVETGQTLPLIICDGFDAASQDVMDSGVRRNLADALDLAGETNTHALAATITWLSRYQSGNMRAAGSYALTAPQGKAILAAHPGLREAVLAANRLRSSVRVQPGLFGALFYIFTALDYDDAADFFEHLRSGVGLEEEDPRYLLRRFLISEITATRRTPAWRVAALTIKAWNAWRDGEKMRNLSFRAGGASPEAFPEAR